MDSLTKYSYSKVTHFYSCPFGFFKHYFEEDREDNSHGTSEFGGFMHEILEKYSKNELKLDELPTYYVNNYDENVKSSFVLYLSENFSKDFSKTYFDSGLAYLTDFNGFNDWKILEAEHEFDEVIDDKFIFTGKIDLIVEDENGDLIVCDHKSKSKFKSKKEKAEYARQLYLYSYNVFNTYHRLPKKLIFNMFRENNLVEIEFNIDDYNKTMQWLKDSVEEIESCFEFPCINDTFYCRNFCEYRDRGYVECRR